MDMALELRKSDYFFREGGTPMGRKYTPEQEIANRRSKGEITHQQATRLLKKLSSETAAEKVEEAKANRSLIQKIKDFWK